MFFCLDVRYQVAANILCHLLNLFDNSSVITLQPSYEISQTKPLGSWFHIGGLVSPERSDINLALLVLKTNGVAAERSNVQVFLAALQ